MIPKEFELPLEEFTNRRNNEVYSIASGRKIIYLDLKYLIGMRDGVFNNKSTNPESNIYKEIFFILLKLVETKKVICPISYMILAELDKQKDNLTLYNTCQIIDQLSLSIAIDERKTIISEYVNLSNSIKNKETFRILCLCYVACVDMYFFNPIYENTDRSFLNNIEKNMFIDSILKMNTAQLFSLMRQNGSKYNIPTQDFSDFLSANKEEKGSYKNMLKENIKGLIAYLNNITKKDLHLPSNYYFGVIKDISPSLYYLGQILTIKQQRINEAPKNNDFYDMYHSVIALSYCDYFFTEKSFHHLLTTNPFDNQSNCIIEFNPENVLYHLKELVQN